MILIPLYQIAPTTIFQENVAFVKGLMQRQLK